MKVEDLQEVFQNIKGEQPIDNSREAILKKKIAEAEEAGALLDILEKTGIVGEQIESTLENHLKIYGNLTETGSSLLTLNKAIETAAHVNRSTWEKTAQVFKGLLVVNTDMTDTEKERVLQSQQNINNLMKMNTEANKLSKQMKDVVKSKIMIDVQKMKPGFAKGAITGQSQGIEGGFKGIAGSALHKVPIVGSTIGPAVGATTVLVEKSMQLAEKGVSTFNQMLTGLDGTLQAGAKAIGATVKKLTGSSAAGGIAGGIAAAIIQMMRIKFEETLASSKIGVATKAQLGWGPLEKGQGGAQKEASGLRALLGREGAVALGTGLAKEGVTDKTVVGKTAKGKDIGVASATAAYGMTTGKGIEGATQELGQYTHLLGNAKQGLTAMTGVWGAMQEATKGTNLSVGALSKGILDAATASRFMNVDIRAVAGFMGQMAKDSENLGDFGITQKDFGKVTGELSGSAMAGKTGLLAALGMQSGEKDAMSGWAKMRFGKSTADNLKYEGGGFTAKGGLDTGSAPTLEIAEQLKKMGVDATAGMTDEKEILFAQMQLFKDLGLSEEAATTLAVTKQDAIGKATLKKMHEEGMTQAQHMTRIYGVLQPWAAKSENVQRSMAEMTLGMLTQAMLLPLHIKDAFTKGNDEPWQIALKKSSDAANTMVAKSMKTVAGEIKSVLPDMGNIFAAYTLAGKGDASEPADPVKVKKFKKTRDSLPVVDKKPGADKKPGVVVKKEHGGAATAPFIAGEQGAELIVPKYEHGSPGYNVIPAGTTNSILNTTTTNNNSSTNNSNSLSTSSNSSNITINIVGITKDQVLAEVMAQLRELV